MEKYKEIERSIITTYRKEIWSKFVKAVSDYKLIEENDNVMVCISGGKDSFYLRSVFKNYKGMATLNLMLIMLLWILVIMNIIVILY